jgi:hypothetical protein
MSTQSSSVNMPGFGDQASTRVEIRISRTTGPPTQVDVKKVSPYHTKVLEFMALLILLEYVGKMRKVNARITFSSQG